MTEKSLFQKIYDELLYNNKISKQSDVATKLEYGESYISKLLKSREPIPEKVKYKLIDVFGISKQYLDSNGKDGAMFKNESEQEPEPERPPKRVPIYGEAAAGGDMEMNMQEHPYTPDYIDVGDLLRDSEAAFIVYGNSMTPAYPSGCILGIRRCYDKFIQPGETYLIETASNRVFKRLYYNDDKSGYTCFSDNTMKHEAGPMEGKYFYPPFDIKFEDIIRLFDITGMIRRNRNSGIIKRQT